MSADTRRRTGHATTTGKRIPAVEGRGVGCGCGWGVSLAVTRYEEAAILGDDSELAEKTLHRLLAEGRFTPDGDSYIPGGVVLAFNKEHDTEYSARDISLDV